MESSHPSGVSLCAILVVSWPRESLQSGSDSNTKLKAQVKIGKCYFSTWSAQVWCTVHCKPPPFILPDSSVCFSKAVICVVCDILNPTSRVKHRLPSHHVPCAFLALTHLTHILSSAASSLPQGQSLTLRFVRNLPGEDLTAWQHTSKRTIHQA